MANAYFACVNDNGGINGHPIKYFIETEQTNPPQIAVRPSSSSRPTTWSASSATPPSSSARSTTAIGSSSGYNIIDSGIAPECYSTSHSAASTWVRGTAPTARSSTPSASTLYKIVFDQSNVPGTRYIAAGPNAIAKAAGVPITTSYRQRPINDASSVAIDLVDAAGPNGAVVLNFTPPEALIILQAAQKLNIEDKVNCGPAPRRATPISWRSRSGRSGTASCSSTPS